MTDPIINEVRMYRDKHSRQFNYALDAIVADYQAKHQKYVAILAKLRNDEIVKKMNTKR